MENLLQKIIGGARFSIDFAKRSLKVNGKNVPDFYRPEVPDTVEVFLNNVEGLYERYKHSVPSERSESRSRLYFRALPEGELDNDDMFYGMARETTRFTLEFYILQQLMAGFKWDEGKMGKWFYQSQQDKDLVILRQWFENKNKQ